MRCRCATSLSFDSPNDWTAAPSASPRLAISTALPVICAATPPSLSVCVPTSSVNCVPTRCSSAEDVATSASTAARCSLDA
ncbi:Uncharacterised protein [Burkholderia pseudomallei]|nr:Uncharacterised protein [Burkholderia pseudomallei]